MDRAEIADRLRSARIWDSGWLKPAGRGELDAALDRWEADGRRARVVLAERGTDLAALRPLWGDLGLDPESDLLLLYNGERWEARGWGLDDGDIAAALDAAEPELADYVGKGLVAALDGLGAATGGGAPGWLLPVGGAAAVAGFGLMWLIARRERVRRTEGTKLLADARDAAEGAYASLILDADRLGPESFDLQEQAARLRRELDVAAREAGDPKVRAGRMRQVEDEIAALQSTVLQRAKGER